MFVPPSRYRSLEFLKMIKRLHQKGDVALKKIDFQVAGPTWCRSMTSKRFEFWTMISIYFLLTTIMTLLFHISRRRDDVTGCDVQNVDILSCAFCRTHFWVARSRNKVLQNCAVLPLVELTYLVPLVPTPNGWCLWLGTHIQYREISPYLGANCTHYLCNVSVNMSLYSFPTSCWFEIVDVLSTQVQTVVATNVMFQAICHYNCFLRLVCLKVSMCKYLSPQDPLQQVESLVCCN